MTATRADESAALLDGSAHAIAAAVRTGAASAREIAEDELNRIKARNEALGAFTDVTAVRALAKADAIDAARARGADLGPLAGRAVRGQEPLRHRRLADPRGLQDQPRSSAGQGRRDRGRPSGSSRGRPDRLAQHGRIRLRLHRPERPRRPVAQSARSRPHDRGIVRRFGGGRGWRPGSDRPGIGHQRVHSRAEFALRVVRPQADLREVVARRRVPVRRQSRSCGAARAIGRRSGARL